MNRNSHKAIGHSAPVAGRGPSYSVQRRYVAFMMWLIARLLQAASAVDRTIRSDVADLPEGFSFCMRVRSGAPALTMKKSGDGLTVARGPSEIRPTLAFEFKHVAHAFLVLSFQESTPRAFANDRLSINGEFTNAMKVLRCLNRMQALVLPRFVARRALKEYPAIGLAEKLALAARIYGRFVIDLFRRDSS
jgi:hypothetical protein